MILDAYAFKIRYSAKHVVRKIADTGNRYELSILFL